MNASKNSLKVVAKMVIEEGIDIRLLIVYMEELLGRPFNENDLFERMKRKETLKFLHCLKEIEHQYPWAIITPETHAKANPTLTSVKKLLRLFH
ncbi:hypothetical protein [Ohtaekwangia sp.]|uniref:hypothetical protein n=1 Tax=Ohtaekwangia sp. TaxID=2066019 RepID=UPI002FDDA5DC